MEISPIHASTSALVLSLSTGRVSPQFHVSFYPSFTTTNGRDVNIIPPSYWQAMCGFVKIKNGCPCILINIIHQLHSFLCHIKVSLTVIIPSNHSKRLQYHCSNIISSKHQFSNPHRSSNQQYSLKLLTTTQRISSQVKSPDPTWDRYFQHMHKNMLQLLIFHERSCKLIQ